MLLNCLDEIFLQMRMIVNNFSIVIWELMYLKAVSLLGREWRLKLGKYKLANKKLSKKKATCVAKRSY